MPNPLGLSRLPAATPILPPAATAGAPAAAEAGAETPDFGSVLADAIHRVDSYRAQAESSADRFLHGEDEEVHQVVLAGQRAELAFETFLTVRNKVVQAYQDIMRMQL